MFLSHMWKDHVFNGGLSDACFRVADRNVVMLVTFVYTTGSFIHTRILLVMSNDLGVFCATNSQNWSVSCLDCKMNI